MAFLLLPTSAFQPPQPLLYNLCHPCVFAGVSSFCFGVGMTALAKNVSLLCCCALLLHQSNISLLQCPPLHFTAFERRVTSLFAASNIGLQIIAVAAPFMLLFSALGARRTCVCREQLHSLHHFPSRGLAICWYAGTDPPTVWSIHAAQQSKGCLGFVFGDAANEYLFSVKLLWICFW